MIFTKRCWRVSASEVSWADASWQSVKPILKPEASAELRDQLVAEMNDLGSSDEAATWAHRSLGEKNRLTAADALRVEEVFQSKLANFAAPVAEALRRAPKLCCLLRLKMGIKRSQRSGNAPNQLTKAY
jgi:hypothetical protein